MFPPPHHTNPQSREEFEEDEEEKKKKEEEEAAAAAADAPADPPPADPMEDDWGSFATAGKKKKGKKGKAAEPEPVPEPEPEPPAPEPEPEPAPAPEAAADDMWGFSTTSKKKKGKKGKVSRVSYVHASLPPSRRDGGSRRRWLAKRSTWRSECHSFCIRGRSVATLAVVYKRRPSHITFARIGVSPPDGVIIRAAPRGSGQSWVAGLALRITLHTASKPQCLAMR